jgi:hypothetical protein
MRVGVYELGCCLGSRVFLLVFCFSGHSLGMASVIEEMVHYKGAYWYWRHT